LFATHVQLDEIDKTLRANACTTSCGVRGDCCRELATESAWGVIRWNQAKWTAGDSVFKAMLACHKASDKASKKRHLKQSRDILIAETAIRNGLILVSGDAKLRTVTIKFGGRAIDREQFMLATGH
jgi:hypothetical protein